MFWVCRAADTASLATWFLFGKLFGVAALFDFGEKRCRKNLPLSDLRSMKDIVSFTVDDVELTTNTGFIGFADSVNERYFWLQPGETSTGLSPIKSEIWLERDDQRFGGSDGDWKISLSRDTFTVFTRGSAWLACDKIEIHFTIDDNSFNTLLTLLKTVMIDCADDLHVEH